MQKGKLAYYPNSIAMQNIIKVTTFRFFFSYEMYLRWLLFRIYKQNYFTAV